MILLSLHSSAPSRSGVVCSREDRHKEERGRRLNCLPGTQTQVPLPAKPFPAVLFYLIISVKRVERKNVDNVREENHERQRFHYFREIEQDT